MAEKNQVHSLISVQQSLPVQPSSQVQCPGDAHRVQWLQASAQTAIVEYINNIKNLEAIICDKSAFEIDNPLLNKTKITINRENKLLKFWTNTLINQNR